MEPTPIFFNSYDNLHNKKRLIQIGIIKVCKSCGFIDTNRTGFRIHLRELNHIQEEHK